MTSTVADPAPGQAVMLFDGDCAFCRKGVSIVKSLDWLGRLHYQNARDEERWPPSAVPLDSAKLMDEMHLVTPNRQAVHVGFSAFRWMAWRLPLTILVAPLLYIPGVPWLGNRAYRWVARNRYKLIPCEHGACKVPLKSKSAK